MNTDDTKAAPSPAHAARCGSCGADIVWARTITRKPTPMQVDPSGTWVIVDGITRKRGPYDQAPFFTSHFATCPEAKNWRKR